MKNRISIAVSVVLLLTNILLGYMLYLQMNHTLIGRVEKVYVRDGNITLTGRIDTGAGVASLNAEIIEIKKPSEPGGAEKVVFRIEDENKQTKILERTIVEWQNIKKKGSAGYSRRPVVLMDFCIGGKRVEARVNLTDRETFLYPLLVGRNILKAGDFWIDPAKKFIGNAHCTKGKKR